MLYLIKAGHYHLVITIPDEYKDIWLIDQTVFINSFFNAVNKGFKKLEKQLGLMLGITTVFQSHGVGLSYKPHMHCIVTRVGLNSQNKCVKVRSMTYSIISDVIRSELKKDLISKLSSDMKNISSFLLKKCNPKKYSVYPAVHESNGDSIVDYLSKTTSGVPVNIDTLEHDKERNKIIIHDFHNGEERITELGKFTFVQRYMEHIPPKRVVTIRSYGLYSNKNKQRLEIIKRLLNEKVDENKEEEEVNETCPECHHDIVEKKLFTPHDEYPLILKLYLKKYKVPPKHGSRLELK